MFRNTNGFNKVIVITLYSEDIHRHNIYIVRLLYTNNNLKMETMKPQGSICQSCSMPMVKKEDFGTNADGSQNNEYCTYCFQNGNFAQPGATMKQVIEKSVEAMKQMKMPETLIEQTRKTIPTLKRWRS
jgi:hypothetical protein